MKNVSCHDLPCQVMFVCKSGPGTHLKAVLSRPCFLVLGLFTMFPFDPVHTLLLLICQPFKLQCQLFKAWRTLFPINLYPVASVVCLVNTYLLDSDLSTLSKTDPSDCKRARPSFPIQESCKKTYFVILWSVCSKRKKRNATGEG